eukprot:3725944-Rhodomonas_salina.1
MQHILQKIRHDVTRLTVHSTQGNGECVLGECVCNEGYTGPDCADFSCKNACSGHGSCNEALKRCECAPWYTGDDCSVGLCPFGCSGAAPTVASDYPDLNRRI